MKHPDPPSRASILLVDDDQNLRRVLEFQLSESGFDVTSVEDGDRGLERVRASHYDLVLTDLVMPGVDGLEFLRQTLALSSDLAVILMTAHADVPKAVRAMQLGALDFLEKPFGQERLLGAIRRALEFVGLRDENRRLRALVQEHASFANIIGSSPALDAVLQDLRLAAESDATVLLLGESGTGKELAARALHLNSRRRNEPFVVVNCAAIPENLIEAELFGHRRGAFTGAVGDRTGKFGRADGGTIFLDEISELSPGLQSRLLRVLQEGEIDPIGAEGPLQVNVRVVAATHADLETRVADGRFREDLYYRLNIVPLRLPPLRERAGDVALLAQHFIAKHARRHGRPLPGLSPAVLERLEGHDWPGNVRELENLVERLVVLAREESIRVEDLPAAIRDPEKRLFGGARVELPSGGIDFEELERSLLREALARCDGNRSAAARFLGLSRQTLLYRIQKHHLD